MMRIIAISPITPAATLTPIIKLLSSWFSGTSHSGGYKVANWWIQGKCATK